METVVVSRHPAAIELILSKLVGHGEWTGLDPATLAFTGGEVVIFPDGRNVEEGQYTVRVVPLAEPGDVKGTHVYGNVPLRLAALAVMVTAIEFESEPPRGKEYDLADMKAAGVRFSTYQVFDA